MDKKIVIAIDGYSSTGKSTFAKLIAARLGYIYIDTGAMYRAVTLLAQRKGLIDSSNNIDVPALRSELFDGPGHDVNFRVREDNGSSETYLDGENVENQIRSMGVSSQVSPIAAVPCVREFVNIRLSRIGAGKGVVMDGRDIGTAVFPNAELKIFMTASPDVRARRRLMEMQAKGQEGTFEQVLANLRERDYVDSHRETDPLTKAEDAVVLDNSDLSIEQQLDWIDKILEKF